MILHSLDTLYDRLRNRPDLPDRPLRLQPPESQLQGRTHADRCALGDPRRSRAVGRRTQTEATFSSQATRNQPGLG